MYIDLPNYCFAYNAKCGCSSFARAMIAKYFTEHEPKIKQLLDENVENHHRHLYFFYVKKVITAYKPVVLLVRNPIDRFLSAMNYLRLQDVDLVLSTLENKSKIKIESKSKPFFLYDDEHFREQRFHLSHENYLFKFPDHIKEAAEFLELNEIQKLNSSLNPKLVLTELQKTRILKIYKKDIILFNAIQQPRTRICSKIKIEWNELFEKLLKDELELQSSIIQKFLQKYPYSKNLIVNDIVTYLKEKSKDIK